MEKEIKNPRVEELLVRWGRRDRFVALCQADYTDMALGLGETKLALCIFACSSAHLWHAHERAARMGHEAQGLQVSGDASEDFKRMLGVTARAWSTNASWNHRSVEVQALREAGGDAEVGLICARSDMRKGKQDMLADIAVLRRLAGMYGVESSEPGRLMYVIEESSRLEELGKHPKLWEWLAEASRP